MKDKKKQGSEPTVSFIFEGGIPFQKINDYSWALGLAIMGHARESLEDALNGFEQLLHLQASLHLKSDSPSNYWEENILLPNMYLEAAQKAKLIHLPIAAGVLWDMYQIHEGNPLVMEALQKYYPTLLAYHNKLYQQRDPHEDGLISNIHPWETLHGQAAYWRRKLGEIVSAKDTNANKSTTAYHLLELIAQSQQPFKVQDPIFHAFLNWSNESLIQIGGVLGEDVLDIIEKYELSVYCINERLWDEEEKLFLPI